MSAPVRIVKRKPANRCTRCSAAAEPGQRRCAECNAARRVEYAQRQAERRERVPTFEDYERLVPE
jgi:predicted nucleic acid-binding Zn ribbon protein